MGNERRGKSQAIGDELVTLGQPDGPRADCHMAQWRYRGGVTGLRVPFSSDRLTWA